MFLSRKKPPLIGLDISSTSVKLMELSKTGSSYRIEGIGVEPLPANAVVEKNVAEVESVGESVKRALAKSKVKSKNCAIAVSGSSVITKKITMPASLSEDEMEGNIQLEADQYIPYPLEEVNLDFHVLGESENNPETVDVLLAACRSENVDDRVAAVELAGLTPKIVDIEAYTVETVFSAMAAHLPEDMACDVSMETGFGKVVSSLPVKLSHGSVDGTDDEATGSLNGGGERLTMRSSSGSVNLRGL